MDPVPRRHTPSFGARRVSRSLPQRREEAQAVSWPTLSTVGAVRVHLVEQLIGRYSERMRNPPTVDPCGVESSTFDPRHIALSHAGVIAKRCLGPPSAPSLEFDSSHANTIIRHIYGIQVSTVVVIIYRRTRSCLVRYDLPSTCTRGQGDEWRRAKVGVAPPVGTASDGYSSFWRAISTRSAQERCSTWEQTWNAT